MIPVRGRALRLVVLAVASVGVILPILAGLWETLIVSVGILPAIGAETVTLEPFRRLIALPGVETSLRLTLWVGFASTLLSLALATGFCAALHGRFTPRTTARVLAPFLAAPHAALAIGLAFLLAPSGWIVRLLSPWATGWTLPPPLPFPNDPWGIALILGMMVKEVPFFLLVITAALGQIPARRTLAIGHSLGYGRGVVWIKAIMPQVYPLIRLPIYVVLSFALSVVDVALILGPSNPPVLSVAVMRWFLAPDVSLILPAAAAAMLQSLIVILGIAVWWVAERMAMRVGRWWIRRGGRGMTSEPLAMTATAATSALIALGALALMALLVWSLTWRWTFPDALPREWSLTAWMRPTGGLVRAAANTTLIGLITTGLALALAIAWLEGEVAGRMRRRRWATGLIYLPLLVPQIAFLYGLNVVFLRAGISGGLAAVIWTHALFVFPYVMIALSDPWRALDRRLVQSAAALGAGPWRRLFAVKLPVLLRPVLTAAAIGFAVSVAQYLPTLFAGAGRVATLTTEAVTLSSGSDRRITGVYAVLQSALPFAAYVAALLLPAVLQRNRRGLTGGFA
jgi:putative thiamine transport system permease protein